MAARQVSRLKKYLAKVAPKIQILRCKIVQPDLTINTTVNDKIGHYKLLIGPLQNMIWNEIITSNFHITERRPILKHTFLQQNSHITVDAN